MLLGDVEVVLEHRNDQIVEDETDYFRKDLTTTGDDELLVFGVELGVEPCSVKYVYLG